MTKAIVLQSFQALREKYSNTAEPSGGQNRLLPTVQKKWIQVLHSCYYKKKKEKYRRILRKVQNVYVYNTWNTTYRTDIRQIKACQ